MTLLALSAAACGSDKGESPRPSGRQLPDGFTALDAAGAVVCPTPVALGTPAPNADYFEFVIFNGILYEGPGAFSGMHEQRVDSDRIGKEFGRTAVKLGTSPQGFDYRLRSCDASFAEVGTPFHRVEGHDPTFLIARADGVIYQAKERVGVINAGDLLQIEGKVASLDLVVDEPQGSRILAVPSARIEEFEAALLQSTIADDSPLDGEPLHVSLRFTMDDGLIVERPLANLGSDWIRQIAPSSALIELVREVIGAP